MRHAHEFLVARLVSNPRSVTVDQTLAYHHEQLGAVRDAARAHLRLLRTYWSVRPRERPYELIESVCRNGLELLASHGHTVTAPTRRHLFCFYLKQWINALWARNLFTHARPIIDEWTKRLGEPMPTSVAPRYVRSVLELEGPDAALAVVDGFLAQGPVGLALQSRMELERSLCLHQGGFYKRALDVLEHVRPELLTLKDRYRADIYRAMHLGEIEGSQSAMGVMESAMEPASKAGCMDESLLMRGLVARALLETGKTRASLSVAAAALRLAHSAGLHYRANLMYRLAASAYVELGDVRRARRCQENAIQVAEAIGVRDMAGVGWARLAAAERMAGRFGNSRRYFGRAIAVLGYDAPMWTRVTTQVGMYGTMVLIRDKRRTAKEAELNRLLAEAVPPVDLGFFHGWRGLDRELGGDQRLALRDYAQAQASFLQAQHSSNLAWALAREARIHLSCGECRKAADILDRLSGAVSQSSSREAEFELLILRTSLAYLERAPASRILALVTKCEASLRMEQHAYLRIEALKLLLRIYARCGKVNDATTAFTKLRELVLEVTSDLSADEGNDFAESIDLADSIREHALTTRAIKAGGP
jgi:tetratricopeptide (TPR) repeat protein